MNIGRQWKDRLEIWNRAFEKHYLSHSIPVSLSYFTTMEHLPASQANARAFEPAPVGTSWGKKWEYGWFKTSFSVPEEWDGKRLCLFLGCGEEMLVFVNGAEAGSIDKKHTYIPITRCAKAGDTFEILAECYAGHGLRMEDGGIVGPHEITVPEPKEPQLSVKPSFAAVWNEEMFQAAMDYRCLYSLVKKLPEKSLRAMKIIEALKSFTYIADFELEEPFLTESVIEARRCLAPLMACTNGSTSPEFTVFGQSHLDMAWLWPVEETVRKTARTYSNQLNLMDEYPEYLFLLCEPPILEYLKAHYPGLHVRVMKKASEGAFIPEGALWIESDVNIPSGESLIRQFAWGRRWFRKHMNADAILAWMPDTFGFSAQLPQIMKKCGVSYFATQKLLRQDPEADPFPYNLFWWQGLDGSRVLSHIFKKNNANFDSGDLVTRWEEDRIQTENIDGMLYPFGFGDGGGGPTREMLELAKRCRNLEGAPECRMESPVRYFERALAAGVENVYAGELYLAWHRGTLTSQAKTKKGIRKAEIALKKAEYVLSALMLSGKDVREKKKELDDLWEKLLFNEFHDIAPGTSIECVHRRAEQELESVTSGAKQMIADLLGRPEGALSVCNHTSFSMRYMGHEIAPQSVKVISSPAEGRGYATARTDEATGGYILENRRMVCVISKRGEVTSVKLKGADREFMAGNGNVLLMYRDVNTCYDAWEMGSMYENLPVPLTGPVHTQLVSHPDGAAIRVEREIHASKFSQTILLGHDAESLLFITHVDWQERHKLLKVSFPVNVQATEALHEIQFGFVKRPTHDSRQHDRDQYEVCNHRYTCVCDNGGGAAVINDCKYGVSASGSDIRLTLLKSPLMPDMNADRGEHMLTYAFHPFDGAFAQSGVVKEAVSLNEGAIVFSGNASLEEGIFVSDKANIIVDTVKPSDVYENALLVRAYEAMGMQTTAGFAVSDKVVRVSQADMLEENLIDMPLISGVSVPFSAFEIKTFVLFLD